MTREYTKKLMDMMDAGLISYQAVAEMALGYLSEYDVEDMMRSNDILEEEDEDEEDEADCDDSDDGYALASAGFGTDEDYGSAEDTY